MTSVKLDEYSSRITFYRRIFVLYGRMSPNGDRGCGPKPYTCLQNFGRFAPTVFFKDFFKYILPGILPGTAVPGVRSGPAGTPPGPPPRLLVPAPDVKDPLRVRERRHPRSAHSIQMLLELVYCLSVHTSLIQPIPSIHYPL